MVTWIVLGVAVALVLALVLPSIRIVAPDQVGLVMKRFGLALAGDNPIAFDGEAGYQADLLMPGWRFKLWLLYAVDKYPWVQVGAGQVGVVVAQVGKPLPVGAKSAVYRPQFGNFTDLRAFVAQGGQKGIQRPVLPPGTTAPIHPIAFLVATRHHFFGKSLDDVAVGMRGKDGKWDTLFGLPWDRFVVTQIAPKVDAAGNRIDTIGVVTAMEGDPLPPEHIAGRLGGFSDVEDAESKGATDDRLVETLLGSQNVRHNNYQDFQAFLDVGGRIGLQHDPILYGAYNLNPFLVQVEIVPMLVVRQGEVAVVKSYVGLSTRDTSGATFKFGSLVRPGHRGIWQEPLRTGKYPLNPRIYSAELVPTAIITLNWADAVSQAHNLDKGLKQIVAKSREGFIFTIDLQVQIHVPDTMAPRVISMVGTMQNLVNEVLQAAVGNHFRDKLQSMEAIRFIESRQDVQRQAFAHVQTELARYDIETRGVYIQDVVLPAELVTVLTTREIANQEIQTFKKQQEAESQRIAMEKTKGEADMQAELAKSQVTVAITANAAEARKAAAEGEAAYVRLLGQAEGDKLKAIGVGEGEAARAVGEGKAKGFEAQQRALGQTNTAIINLVDGLRNVQTRFVPDVLVTGGGGGAGGGLDALVGVLLQHLRKGTVVAPPAVGDGAKSIPFGTSPRG